ERYLDQSNTNRDQWRECDKYRRDHEYRSTHKRRRAGGYQQSKHWDHPRRYGAWCLDGAADGGYKDGSKCRECYEYRSEPRDKHWCADGDQQSSHWDHERSYGQRWFE